MRFFAPAKLNLSLDLGPLRADGYHEIRTIMQAVSLGDRLRIVPAPAFEVDNPAVPEGDLVRSAGELFMKATGVPVRVRIEVVKRIPIGAGLGGGSSDAACVLRALRELLRPDLPAQDLLALGAQLGSDVPFFLGPSPLALAEGRGERLKPLAARPPSWAVIAWPEDGISTASVYRASEAGPGGACDAVLAGAPQSRNDLEPAARRLSPNLDMLLQSALAHGAPFQVTGSGSAAFALCEDPLSARAALSAVRPHAHRAALCATLSHWPWQVNQADGNE